MTELEELLRSALAQEASDVSPTADAGRLAWRTGRRRRRVNIVATSGVIGGVGLIAVAFLVGIAGHSRGESSLTQRPASGQQSESPTPRPATAPTAVTSTDPQSGLAPGPVVNGEMVAPSEAVLKVSLPPDPAGLPYRDRDAGVGVVSDIVQGYDVETDGTPYPDGQRQVGRPWDGRTYWAAEFSVSAEAGHEAVSGSESSYDVAPPNATIYVIDALPAAPITGNDMDGQKVLQHLRIQGFPAVLTANDYLFMVTGRFTVEIDGHGLSAGRLAALASAIRGLR